MWPLERCRTGRSRSRAAGGKAKRNIAAGTDKDPCAFLGTPTEPVKGQVANQCFAVTFVAMFKAGENGSARPRRNTSTMKVRAKAPGSTRLRGQPPVAHVDGSRVNVHDKQSEPDYRKLRIDKVGVRGLRFPIQVRDKERSVQNTVATIGMFVDLPQEFKGTHMSRFIEVLNAHGNVIHVENIP